MENQLHPNRQDETIAWRGFHHLALVTRDLDATLHFYGGVLGMQVGEVMDRGGRHCFIQPGGDSWGLHFFEHRDAEIFTQPELLRERSIFLSGALQHIAFALPDETTALKLRERLSHANITMTGINELPRLRNFLFFDNNGILLEAAWGIP